MPKASIHEFIAAKVRELIAKNGPMLKSQITRRLSHIAPQRQRNAAIAWLVRQGEIVIEKQGGAGSGRRGRPGELLCAA